MVEHLFTSDNHHDITSTLHPKPLNPKRLGPDLTYDISDFRPHLCKIRLVDDTAPGFTYKVMAAAGYTLGAALVQSYKEPSVKEHICTTPLALHAAKSSLTVAERSQMPCIALNFMDQGSTAWAGRCHAHYQHGLRLVEFWDICHRRRQ